MVYSARPTSHIPAALWLGLSLVVMRGNLKPRCSCHCSLELHYWLSIRQVIASWKSIKKNT